MHSILYYFLIETEPNSGNMWQPRSPIAQQAHACITATEEVKEHKRSIRDD